jgi:asparagine synthetase B (glutamine-hydrolysing)
MGVNKLFLAVDGVRVASSNYLLDLLCQGFPIHQISSVPSGHALWVDTAARTLTCRPHTRLAFNDHDEVHASNGNGNEVVQRIQTALDAAFRAIRSVVAGRPVYVTMSGGLDSTVIAMLACDYLPEVRGVTLSVVSDSGDAADSEDVHYARVVARDLGIPLTVVTVTADDILAVLDDVLRWGQDWRDFNVHCGLVNAALGRRLRTMLSQDGEPPLLLSGDTMNEMVADYSPVRYEDREFYPLPRLSRGQLRRFLVAGLDSGDREVGILAKMGFSVIQPYALCAAAYLALPPAFLERPDAKQELARRVMENRIPTYVLKRPKVRAQAADSTHIGGTMAVMLKAGLDQAFLRQRWCELFGLPPTAPDNIIRAGVYKRSLHLYS